MWGDGDDAAVIRVHTAAHKQGRIVFGFFLALLPKWDKAVGQINRREGREGVV